MRIINLVAENFKKLVAIDITPDGTPWASITFT